METFIPKILLPKEIYSFGFSKNPSFRMEAFIPKILLRIRRSKLSRLSFQKSCSG